MTILWVFVALEVIGMLAVHLTAAISMCITCYKNDYNLIRYLTYGMGFFEGVVHFATERFSFIASFLFLACTYLIFPFEIYLILTNTLPLIHETYEKRRTELEYC